MISKRFGVPVSKYFEREAGAKKANVQIVRTGACAGVGRCTYEIRRENDCRHVFSVGLKRIINVSYNRKVLLDCFVFSISFARSESLYSLLIVLR